MPRKSQHQQHIEDIRKLIAAVWDYTVVDYDLIGSSLYANQYRYHMLIANVTQAQSPRHEQIEALLDTLRIRKYRFSPNDNGNAIVYMNRCIHPSMTPRQIRESADEHPCIQFDDFLIVDTKPDKLTVLFTNANCEFEPLELRELFIDKNAPILSSCFVDYSDIFALQLFEEFCHADRIEIMNKVENSIAENKPIVHHRNDVNPVTMYTGEITIGKHKKRHIFVSDQTNILPNEIIADALIKYYDSGDTININVNESEIKCIRPLYLQNVKDVSQTIMDCDSIAKIKIGLNGNILFKPVRHMHVNQNILKINLINKIHTERIALCLDMLTNDSIHAREMETDKLMHKLRYLDEKRTHFNEPFDI